MKATPVRTRAGIGVATLAIAAVLIVVAVGLGFAVMHPQASTGTTSTGTQAGTMILASTSSTSQGSTSNSSASTATASSSTSSEYAYLNDNGGCTVDMMAAPCWGGGASSAVVFDCLTAAQSDQGCTQSVSVTSTSDESSMSMQSFTINIRYPFTNSTAPAWSNCFWELPGEASAGWGYCSDVSSNSFVIAQPAAPPQ